MKLLLACLSVVYYLTASVSSQSSECTNVIQECANVYIADIEKHARDRNIDLICRDLNTFVGCIFSLKCDLSESQKKSYIEETREQIADANINCDIDYTGNSGQTSEQDTNSKTDKNMAAKIGTFLTVPIVLIFSVYFNTIV